MITGRYHRYGKYVKAIKDTFPDYYPKLDSSLIKGCIGYLKFKENADRKCVSLDITRVEIKDSSLTLEFEIIKELDISNDQINKSLYKYAHRSDWIDKTTGYFPLICIVDKTAFDEIRKGGASTRKVSSHSAILEELKRNNDWLGICNKFGPLDMVKDNNEIWNNPSDLYDLAFACSKLGEPKNGLERNKGHLKQVREYREYSILFYKRCYELEPNNHQYASALGYRYYLNVMELTKPKGRRDGKVEEEIKNALFWLDKAILLNPHSIKNYYRKGKIILDKQLDNFKRKVRNWTYEDFNTIEKMESEGEKSLKKGIEIYENLTDKQLKAFCFKEYVRSLYTLGTFYLSKINADWEKYIFSKLANKELILDYDQKDAVYIDSAREHLDKCFQAESDISLYEQDIDATKLARFIRAWAVSPIDKLYRLGVVNLEACVIEKMSGRDPNKGTSYGDVACKFMSAAINIAREAAKQGTRIKNTNYINEKLARYYIISERYDDAIKLTSRCREPYIKNTYAIALIMSGDKGSLKKAANVLENTIKDRYNLSKNVSVILCAYTYKLMGDERKATELIESQQMSKRTRVLAEILDLGDAGNESR